MLVEGTKWCGKTTTCEPFAQSILYMADPESHDQNLILAHAHLRNGVSGLIEVKLGGEKLIEEGAATLNALSGIIDTSRQAPVAFKMIVTATGNAAYRRPNDGIVVCPLSALRP